MNKKLGLLLTLLFVGTTVVPAKKDMNAPKKEKVHREYKLSVMNKLDKEVNLTIIDTKGQKHNVSLAAKETKCFTKTTDKKLKIKKIEARAGNKTATKEFKEPTRKAKIKETKKGILKIKRAWYKTQCPTNGKIKKAKNKKK